MGNSSQAVADPVRDDENRVRAAIVRTSAVGTTRGSSAKGRGR
jgi:hypothetical protein